MRKVLVLFTHPRFENSKVNRQLLVRIPASENVTFHDLYENYPDFNVDVAREQHLLVEHDVIIWQHPFYWYSAPPLMKQWIDMVLEYGWAYGTGSEALKGKHIFNAITTGGGPEAYCPDGQNCFSIEEFLRPFEQTARLCLMNYLPPFAVMSTHSLSIKEMVLESTKYGQLIEAIGDESFDLENVGSAKFLNELI